MNTTSLDKSKIRVVLLEGVHPSAREAFEKDGYTDVVSHPKSLAAEELTAALRGAYFVGIRSATQVTAEVLECAPKLIAIGCFCIGTNQVNLEFARKRGIPVFNAPFSNTRSVAELVLAEIVLLMRAIPERNAAALRAKQIGGAALDVFPFEPKGVGDAFVSPLREFDNVILTPHVGGSTEEAQANIGIEVAEKLIRYSNNGSTVTAVNFPQVSLPEHPGKHRLLHIHRNQPGVLSQINAVFSRYDVNIAGQYLQTDPSIGYVVIDVEMQKASATRSLKSELDEVPGTIRSLY